MGDIIPLVAKQPDRLSRPEFRAEVIRLVGLGKVWVHRHLNRDHPERTISQAQIEKCLELGTVQCDPYINSHGNWQAEIFRHMAGQQLTVVAALEWKERIVVVTAY